MTHTARGMRLQLAEEDELMWDDGSANPEPCLDKFDLVTKVWPLLCQASVHSSDQYAQPAHCQGSHYQGSQL